MLAQLRDFYTFREAVRHLVARDLKVRYSNSLLGVLWSLLTPLLMTLVYSVVFGLLLPNNLAAFPVFVLAGLLPWQFFHSALVAGTQSITANSHLINRVYFPREVLPVSAVLSQGVNFLVALALLFGFMLVFRVSFTLHLLWLPLLIAIQLAFTLGLTLVMSALNVYFRDTQQLVDVGLLAWFFLTPVIYPVEYVTHLGLRLALLVANPLASLVVAYRQALYYGAAPDLGLLAITAAQAAVLLLAGAFLFRRLSPRFAEEV